MGAPIQTIPALWTGHKFFTSNYPLPNGAQTSGQAQINFDILKQGVKDTIDTLSINVHGNVVVAGSGPGTATGAYNPQSILVNANLTSAPQSQGLIPVNLVSSRAAVVDFAVVNRQFATLGTIPDTAGTHAVDSWLHFAFKRPNVKKGIEYALFSSLYNSLTLTVTCGTRDQLYSGGTNTWDTSGLVVDFWANLDIFPGGNDPSKAASFPRTIHATEQFEQVFNILANNPTFQINQLPQGVLYDSLYFITEDGGALTDGIINNISVQSGGRLWFQQGESNADFIRQIYTRPHFYDPDTQTDLTGIYTLPLRDGIWSRAIDARVNPIVVYLNVTSLSSTSIVRVCGRKVVPGGIQQSSGVASLKGKPVKK